ncbi:MAG TPA: protease inhibitor I42 family protein [Lysobacter sp.]|jgi:inhibitor of cysteine peptidase|nr:protease inhibitor I42 family protein [Lysobacter sp.]
MPRALLLVSLLAATIAGCTTAASLPMGERELTAADSAAPVKAAPGQLLVVRLAANASTGYSWAWDEAAAAGVLVQDGRPTMTGLDPQRVGSGGTQTWRFRVVASGEGELRLNYRRPWEKDTPPVQTVHWQIQVQ